MDPFEEKRKKAVERMRNRNQSSPFIDARAKAVERMRDNTSGFTPSSTLQSDPTEDESSASGAFSRSAAVNVLPISAGIAAGGQAALAGTAVAGPIGGIVAALAVGIGTSVVTKLTQDKALEVIKGEEWKRNLDQTLLDDREEHPYATFIGGEAPQLIFFKPSPTTLKQAFSLTKRAFSDKASLAKHLKTLEGKTELDALINTSIGSGLDVSMEAYQQAREGDANAIRLISSFVIGGTLSNPTKLGQKVGYNPSGDAVINEYNDLGSKTAAAKIITHGDIPILNRSADAVVKDRTELRSILTGQSEKNRFDNPRILEAERIAGTIDKKVTADSDLNVYRLGGRSGVLQIGERVTANPHIADVFGGKTNPQATVKAGDLVRTTRGDYIYIPKAEIQARPKLPPVELTVKKQVRKQVAIQEKKAVKDLKERGRQAIIKQGEPARLQKEAEELAIKQQQEADKLVKESNEKAEKLKTKINDIKAEEAKAIASEKIKVAKEKIAIKSKLDKEKAKVDTIKRTELAKEAIEHRNRNKKANTDKQKLKESIRHGNKRARIIAKASKDKKALVESSGKAIDNSKEISKTATDAIKVANTEITRLEGVAKDAHKDLVKSNIAVKKVQKKTNNNATHNTSTEAPLTNVLKPKAEKVTLIGTKKVKSKSIIKNAVQEARELSNKAQLLDENVTTQDGTSFVEQTKLSTELIVERGFDDTLKFARDATDAELRELNIDRSGLYRTLLDTATNEGQFEKFRGELEALQLLTAEEVSAAAQKSSLHRMATQNDPFKRVADMKKAIIDNEKKLRKTVFDKEVDELNAKLKDATTEEDINKVIKDNLC